LHGQQNIKLLTQFDVFIHDSFGLEQLPEMRFAIKLTLMAAVDVNTGTKNKHKAVFVQ
jgi:hypothetical protein